MKSPFKISLAQWSLNKALFAKEIDNLDFPAIAKQKFGIDAVEYVNQFFMDKAEDTSYLNELLKRCGDNGVTNHMIMCDNEGNLADKNKKERENAIENHYKWIHAAKYLGCTIIRVNTYGEGSPEEVQKAAEESLNILGNYSAKEEINIVVENHGGITSNGQWLAQLIKNVNLSNVGTLPDFGNFCLKRTSNGCEEEYDRYKGITELMPYAKSVSAKTQYFDEEGNCKETDYSRMIKIVKDSGFKGYLGIEFGGPGNEEEGITKTKQLLEREL
ncbi:MAG: sugar phosphate isomerase/epimerase family protein [Flavisolibacter sp.]